MTLRSCSAKGRGVLFVVLTLIICSLGIALSVSLGSGLALASPATTALPSNYDHVAQQSLTCGSLLESADALVTLAADAARPMARHCVPTAGFVAAEIGSELVPYSPQVASRNLLSQVGDDYAVPPGGRTISAHPADRIANGAAGRAPTTLSRVDDILDNPTATRYDPIRDTVRVSQGKALVVVSGTGQHIVTVMVP